jgi:ribonuclease P protein component
MHRLRRSSDFARVRANGDAWAHQLVVLATAPNERDISRFGFVTGKRMGTAVKRNRAKRVLREAVRQLLPQIPMGWDCVLIARSPLSEATSADARAAIIQLFKRARLWFSTREREEGDWSTPGPASGASTAPLVG